MKKYPKILLLGLVMPLLGSCSPKAPKFAEYSNAVDFAKFAEDFTKAVTENKLLNTESEEKTSYSAVVREANIEEEKLVRGKKEFESEVTKGSMEGTLSYDSANGIIDMVSKDVDEAKFKGTVSNGFEKAKQEVHCQMLPYTVGGEKYFVQAMEENGEYYPLVKDSEAMPIDTAIAQISKSLPMQYVSALMTSVITAYAVSDEEEQAKYKFYVDGAVFTITYEDKVDNFEAKVGEDDPVLAVVNGTRKVVSQAEISNDKLIAKALTEYNYKVEIKEIIQDGTYCSTLGLDEFVDSDAALFLKGDICETNYQEFMDCELNVGEPKIKQLDLAKMKAVGFDEE